MRLAISIAILFCQVGFPLIGNAAQPRSKSNDLLSANDNVVFAEVLRIVATEPDACKRLTQTLADPKLKHPAAVLEGLDYVGPTAASATPLIVKFLAAKRPATRRSAALAVERIGPGAAIAIPDLMRVYQHDEDLGVKIAITKALGFVGRDNAAVAKVLIEGIKDRDGIGLASIEAVGNIGIKALGDAGLLIDIATDVGAQQNRRAESVRSLGRLADGTDRTRAALIALSIDPSAEIREEALLALGSAQPMSPDAVHCTIVGLSDDEPRVRAAAANALGRGGDTTQPVPSELSDACRDPSPLVRTNAAIAIYQLSHDAEGCLPVLLDVIAVTKGTPSEWTSMHRAIVAVGMLGKEGIGALDVLIALANEKQDGPGYRDILITIIEVGDASPPVIAFLEQASRATASRAAADAASALAYIRSKAR